MYIPNLTSPPASIEDYAGEIISKLVDIAGDTDVEFEVPALINGTYLPISCSTLQPSAEEIEQTASGTIALYVVTPPTTYDSTSSYISWFLFQAAASDFQVIRPNPPFGNVWVETPPPPAAKFKSVADSRTPPTHKAQSSLSLTETFSKKFPPMMKTSRFLDNNFANIDPVQCLVDYQRRAENHPDGVDTPNALYFGWLIHPLHDTIADGQLPLSWPRYMAACHRAQRGAQRVQIYDTPAAYDFAEFLQTPNVSVSNARVFSSPPALALELPYIASTFFAPTMSIGYPAHAQPTLDSGINKAWSIDATQPGDLFFSTADDTVYYDFRPCFIVDTVQSVSKSSRNVCAMRPVPLSRGVRKQ